MYAKSKSIHSKWTTACSRLVSCCITGGQCKENSTQLIGELSQSEGFPVICQGGSWGRVFISNIQAASVVCRQLGFSAEGYWNESKY